jgi:hypothetical protein
MTSRATSTTGRSKKLRESMRALLVEKDRNASTAQRTIAVAPIQGQSPTAMPDQAGLIGAAWRTMPSLSFPFCDQRQALSEGQ